ncbi:uncharacterized protein [Leptinotarsa decemlineata]|uniref:uncharacterized protein n=1 Tax=Leptinotarsa decemlineata TaxID=7539 RepID=UPI003D3079F3
MHCGEQRSNKLLEKALKDSEKTSYSTKVSFGADDQSYSDRSSVIDPETIIQNGEELFQFKENLRPRRSNFLSAYCESASSREKEPFSPDVSEYVPSHDENGGSEKDYWQEEEELNEIPAESVRDIIQPSTSSPLNAVAFTTTQDDDAKKNTKRNMSKKSNLGRKRKRNPENWKTNIQKRKKNAGEEFINKGGKLKNIRQMKQGCNEKCKKNALKMCLLQ